jgi:hypothetical protein
MDFENMKEAHTLMEAKLTLHDEKMERMGEDIHDIKNSIVNLGNTVNDVATYITGRKAVVGFIVGVGTVMAGIVGAGVGIIHLFKFFTGQV